MKKFILLSYSLSGMGGAQMYQRNKLEYMKKKGYEVSAIYSKQGDILIEELKKYEKNCIEALLVNPILFNKRKIKSIVKKIIEIVGIIDNETIIETNNKVLGMWGEIISDEYKAINFIYIIDEKIGSLDNNLLEFFKFKKERKELYGIKEETYKMIFNHVAANDNYSYVLPLICSNVVEDYKNYKTDKIEYSELNIATIGRLEKYYVPTLIEEIKEFSQKNFDKKITYIMIGGATKKNIYSKIRKKFNGVKNMKLFLLGDLYPIPLNLLNNIDIFASSAGSARVSANLGKPTIVIDANDYYSIGILDYDTKNTVFRKTEEKIKISDKLEMLCKNDFYKKIKLNKCNFTSKDIDSVFNIHMEKYDRILKNDRIYFGFFNNKISKMKFIEKIILNICGIKIYQKIRNLVFAKIKY